MADEDRIDSMILACYANDVNITPKEISKQIGIHYTNVYKRLKRPAMIDAVTELKGSLAEIIADGKRLAAKKIKRLVMSQTEHISLKACIELLRSDLTGEAQHGTQSIKFITVVNEVGVLESSPSSPSIIDVSPKGAD